MQDELIDVLNKEGQLTGTRQLRSVVHAKGFWHRTVHIYFFRKHINGIEFLVHLRAKTKDLSPDTWDTRFGGHVEAGETIEKAFETELRDEIGITVDPTKLLSGKEQRYEKFPNNELVSIYYYNFDGDETKLRFNDGEVQEVRWMTPKMILQEIKMNSEKWASTSAVFETIISELSNILSYCF